MSCNTFIPIMDLVREVEALLAANYIDKDDPRITGGVFTNPTIREGFLLDVQAREEFCRLVQECGLDAPFGKMWLSRPLYPDQMFVSYEDSGEPQTKWKTIQAVLESAGVFGPEATSLSSRLAAEIKRSEDKDSEIEGEIATLSIATSTNAKAIADETARSIAIDDSTAASIGELKATDTTLQTQIDSIGGGKKAYTTEALMIADKANIAPNSSVDVINDPVPSKNGSYAYDGTSFTKSPYDPLTLAKVYVDSKPTVKHVILTTQSLDNVVESGVYVQNSITQSDLIALKYPENSVGYLTVVSGPGSAFKMQTYTTTTNRIYVRYFTSQWSAWKENDSSATKLPTVTPKNLGVTDNLNDIKITGDYFKVGSGDIELTNGYPVKLAGALEVKAPNVGSVVQKYTTFYSGQTFIRTLTGATFTPWKETTITSPEVVVKPFSRLEWVYVLGGALVYDNATKTVVQTGYILAPYPNSARRIRISNISVTLTGAYDYCYLDLVALGDTLDVDATNQDQFIKVAKYSEATGFQAKPGQHPLFKYDDINKTVVPCAGFVPIRTSTTPGASSGVANMKFSKEAGLMLIYFPMASGYQLRSGLIHNVVSASETSNAQSNTDLWRIYEMNRVDDKGALVSKIANSGEFEMAITHSENTQLEGVPKDHVGGYHGDEILTDIKFFIDGVLKPADFVSGLQPFTEIQVVQHSVVYYQNTTRPLCDHLKIITYKDNKINVRQKMNFKYEATSLSTAWVTMLPILRMADGVQVTDKSSLSIDNFLQVDDNTTEGFPLRIVPVKDGDKIKQWSNISNVSSETTLIKTANFSPAQNLFVTNGGGYNKLYISATNAAVITPHAIPLNTVWDIESEYNVLC